MEKMIYFVTGASGVGKTTLVDRLAAKYKDRPWAFLHFDEIGVPSRVEMEKDFGSGVNWQHAKTLEWIDVLIQYPHEKIFFEGQVNLQFIKEGFERHNYNRYKIILIDCREEEIEKRLNDFRKQPELFTSEMRNWVRFLRQQAKELNETIIDSSDVMTEDEFVMKFERTIRLY